jgi:hypothetical protein
MLKLQVRFLKRRGGFAWNPAPQQNHFGNAGHPERPSKDNANMITGGLGGQESQPQPPAGKKRARDDDREAPQQQQKRFKYHFSEAQASHELDEAVKSHQQRKASALERVALLDAKIAKEKADLAPFGITDFSLRGVMTVDWSKVDSEYARRHREKGQKKLALRAKGAEPAAPTAAVSDQSLVTAPGSQPSNNSGVSVSGVAPVQSLQGAAPELNPASIPLPGRSTAVDNIDMEVDEEAASRMGCMAYWAYNTCMHDDAECPSGIHIWNDSIAHEIEFDEQRSTGDLPPHSIQALEASMEL